MSKNLLFSCYKEATTFSSSFKLFARLNLNTTLISLLLILRISIQTNYKLAKFIRPGMTVSILLSPLTQVSCLEMHQRVNLCDLNPFVNKSEQMSTIQIFLILSATKSSPAPAMSFCRRFRSILCVSLVYFK